MIRARTLAIFKGLAITLWPPSLYAATLTFGQAVEVITPLEWALVIVLSTLSGATALLIKVSDRINNAPPEALVPPIRNLPLLVSAHMMGSWLAGLIAFFGAAHWNMAGLMVGFLVPAVSFGGAKACEMIYMKIIGTASPYIIPNNKVEQ